MDVDFQAVLRAFYRTCLGVCVGAAIFFQSATGAVGYDYIDITNPFLKKIPLAVPLFKDMSSTAQSATMAREASDLLAESLQYTGYFKLVDRKAFLEYPDQTGITLRSLQFKNWTGIGAEILITGGVWMEQGNLKLEMRLFDTFKGERLIGKRYPRNKPGNYRAAVLKFCGEVIQHLTGTSGLFDSRIAFISTGTGAKEIWTCDFDGYAPRNITRTGKITLSPSWSSDGKYLAYTDYKRGKPDLYIKDLAGKKGWVVDKEGSNITPCWVPGQFSLAATHSFSGDPEIYMLTGTGKIIKRLTRNRGIDVSPTFSPDGQKMAFVSKRSGTPQIYVKDLQAGRTRRLTFEGRYNTSPCWSPQGDKIAYAIMTNGQFDIAVIDASGGSPTVLTQNSGDNESPSWSPDGSLIAFSSNREGKNRIYVMTAFGTDQRRLVAMPGEQTQPAWSYRMTNN
jgi:TolB protein